MHYYAWNISDYAAATAYLTNAEDLAYRRLLDLCYSSEKPIPVDTQQVARRIRCGKDEVDVVLKDFFELREDGWHNRRVDEEIANYKARSERSAANGRKGGRPRKQPETQQVATEKATKNQEPRTKNQKTIAPAGVSDEVWTQWVLLRKTKRAPISDLVIKSIRSEAEAAGWTLEQALSECVGRGWAGFRAEWVSRKDAKKIPMADLDYGQGGDL